MSAVETSAGGRGSGRVRTLARAMAFMTGGVLLSRVLGLARDVLLASVWGQDVTLAAFLIAFTLPNLLRNLFGEGAFSAAFVPVISQCLEREGPQAAWRAASRVISVLSVVLAIFVGAGIAVAHWLAPRLPAPLWRETAGLLSWLLPYAFFICLTAAFAGVLYVMHRFGAPALSSIFLNLAFITAAGLTAGLGLSLAAGVRALCFAVLAAGALQLGYVALWARHGGFAFRWQPNFRAPEVREVARLMGPAAIGAGVLQLNVMVDRLLAGHLGAAATTSLYYSQRLVYLPVGLFGVALGTVSLPALSRSAARGDRAETAARLRAGLRLGFFLSLPCAVFLAGGGDAVIRLLFARGRFDAAAVRSTLWPLLFYLPGIPAFVAAKMAVAPFYAAKNTVTPVRISVFCLGLNVVLNLIFMQFLAQAGLALATTLCSYTNVTLLLWAMKRQGNDPGLLRDRSAFLRIGAAAAMAGVALFGLRATGFAGWVAGVLPGLTGRIAVVAGFAAAVAGVYVAGGFLFRCGEIRELLGAFRRRRL